MGTHDREITGDREQTLDGGVVLRFPGDWVGPLEDLVPFGPSADRDSSPADSGGDFWGEGSAALQDALEAPPQPLLMAGTRRLRNRVMAGAAIAAAVLVAVAVLVGGQNSRPPRSHGLTFAIARIPPLAPAASGTGKRTIQVRKHQRTVSQSRRRANPAPPVAGDGSGGGNSLPTVTASSSTYHPFPAPSSASGGSTTASSGSSSQSGGAFTLGGP